MRIAIVSDIHGNLLALEAVLEDLKAQAPDVVVNLGDCVSGALWPEETAQLLIEKNWLTIRGNHDRQLFDRPLEEMGATDAFTLPLLSNASREWLHALPATARLSEEIFLCHATPTNDDLYLTEKVVGPKGHIPTEAEIREKLDGESAPVIFCGHTHIPRLIKLSTGQTILNAGSVGLPSYDDDRPNHHVMEAGSPHARYAIATKTGDTWDFTERMIEYDWDRAAQQAANNGRDDWAASLKNGFFGPLS